jgi:hypothetical protein
MNGTGVFRDMQPKFAAYGIATFPVGMDGDRKKPLVKGYGAVGLRASTQLADKFRDATMLGFMAGACNGITVFDWDSTDEGGFVEALDYFGDTPLKVRTASGKFHALYRHNGEGRRTRQLGDLPADILGGGVVVAAGSVIPGRGAYEIIEGELDDIPYLPVLRNLPPHIYEKPSQIILPEDEPRPDTDLPAVINEGARNDSLWIHCMKAAAKTRHLSEEEGLNVVLLAARKFNESCVPPLEDAEVMEVVSSAWGKELSGENRFGRHGAWFETSEANQLIRTDQDALLLLVYLRANNGPEKPFWCANGLAETLGWSLRRLQGARRSLIDQHAIIQISSAIQHFPAKFGWPRRGRRR